MNATPMANSIFAYVVVYDPRFGLALDRVSFVFRGANMCVIGPERSRTPISQPRSKTRFRRCGVGALDQGVSNTVTETAAGRPGRQGMTASHEYPTLSRCKDS